ncbi:restriction endonuclease [Rhizobacter sp. Root404]|uniref:restriction endonuclease n=1 Tax=Rhizobacter sp. Root404 TaxID=1736528 RepID=UPI00138F1E11|nr:restriction endonuclease [Rhizobacter sp. Root404]
MFLGKSPFGVALRPMAPFGWLIFAVGCGLLWWQIRNNQSKRSDPVLTERDPTPEQFRSPRYEAPPVDRTATEFARMMTPSKPRSAAPVSVPQSWGTAVFDVIEWRRFEALVEALFAQAGFETKSQSHGADEGIDIWLYSRNNPGTPVSVVQCKHWQGKRVGVDKVRELRGVMAAKGVSRGQFATTSTFTEDATAFAKENGVNLLDVKALLALIAKRSEEQQQTLLTVALEGDYWRPTCVNCGIKMVERNPRKGGAAFWGCESYPKCKTSMPMRGAASVA